MPVVVPPPVPVAVPPPPAVPPVPVAVGVPVCGRFSVSSVQPEQPAVIAPAKINSRELRVAGFRRATANLEAFTANSRRVRRARIVTKSQHSVVA